VKIQLLRRDVLRGAAALTIVEWVPAQRLPPYRARSVHAGASRQEHLFDLEEDDFTASAAH